MGIERLCTKVEREVSWITTVLGGSVGRHKERSRSSGAGLQSVGERTENFTNRARVCQGDRFVASDPAARMTAQVKVRSKFFAKNVETTKSSKLALAEELAAFGGCEPVYPLSEATLLTVAGTLDSAGYRSASSYIAGLRLRHVELDFAISPALDRAF